MDGTNDKEGKIKGINLDPLSLIEKNMSDIICIHDPDGRYEYVTGAVGAILGYSYEDLKGTSPYEYFHPDDIEAIRIDSHARALECMIEETRIEYRFRKKDGNYCWLQTQTTPILDCHGVVTGLLTVSRDINDRREAEAKLQENENNYRQLFMRSPVVKLIIDSIEGTIIDANEAAADFYGYTLEKLRSMTIFEIDIASSAEITECMSKVSKEYYKSLPFQHKLKDGSIRDVEVYSGPIRIGDKILLHSIVIDATARKEVEEELEESRERLSLVIQGAKAGIWDWDMRSNQVFHDKQWKAILGYEEDELNDEADIWISRWHPDDVTMIRAAIENYLNGKTEKYEVEYRLRHKDGTYRWILTNGKVTRDQMGQPIRWVGFNIDITDHKRTEELYIESEKRIRDFAEAVPDYSFIFDEDGQYIEVFGNDDLLSRPKEQYKGLYIWDLLEEEDATFVLSEIRQVIASGEKRSGVREMKIGQRKRFILGRTVPLSYEINGKKTVAAIATDITEQRQMERMLQVTYELRRRSDFINDILNGNGDENLAYLSCKIGFDLNLPTYVCKFLSDQFDFSHGDLQGQRINSVQKLKDVLIDALSDIPNCVVWDCREGISALCQARTKASELEHSKAIATLIRNKLLECDSNIAVSVGVSDVHTGIQGLKKSCQQALSAAIATRCQVMEGVDIVHYRESGIFQLIPELLGRDAIKEYIERNIGKLIIYDRAKKMNYILTLEELLRGSSVRETADKLFLHPKTVVFRQKRIEKILNLNLDAYQNRLTLSVALQLYKLNNV